MIGMELFKQKSASMRKSSWTALFVGIILIVFGLWAYSNVDEFINGQIAKQIPVVPGTDSYRKWEKLAVPLTMKFFLFNVTNADKVMQLGDKPLLQEVGPYVFRENRFKTNVRFEHGGEHVLYREAKEYFFDPIRSKGRSLNDTIIVPSIPEVAMASKLSKQAESVPALGTFLYNMLNAAFSTTQTRLFSMRRVGDLLFDGYTVRALERLINITSNIPNNPLQIKSPLPNNRFGFFYLKNGTDDPESAVWRTHTGLNDPTRFGQVITYDDQSQNQCWRRSYYCNAMLGTDGSQFAPNLDAAHNHPSAHPATEQTQSMFRRSLPSASSSSSTPTSSVESSSFRRSLPHATGSPADHLLHFEHGSSDSSGKRRLFVYNPDIYRWVYLAYEGRSEVRGIQAYRYTLPDSFYTAPSDAPENACFCTKASEFNLNEANRKFLATAFLNSSTPQQVQEAYRRTFPPQCRLHGILDISHCRKAPIIISAPHFYKGDPLLIHSVEGLHPSEELHKTFVDIEPRTGIVINAARRAQINIELTPIPRIDMFSGLDRVLNRLNRARAAYHTSAQVGEYNGLIIPVLWLEETATADEKNADLLKSKLLNKIALLNGLTLFLVALGVLLISFAILYFFIVRFLLVRGETVKARPEEFDTLPKKKVPSK